MVHALALLALVQAGAAEDFFPLDPGARWTYAVQGREGMTVEVAGTRKIGGIETRILRVRDGTFFWTSHDLFVSAAEGRLRIVASSYNDDVFEKGRVLLQAPLAKGKTWTEGVEASVLGREDVDVPAGRYSAWMIEYQLRGHLGTELDFRAWFAPGAGFVKFEYFQESSSGQKKPVEKTWAVELVRFDRGSRRTSIDFPKLGEEERRRLPGLLARLADDSPEVREKSVAELVALGRGVIPQLKEAMKTEASVEARGRLRDVLDRFPPLEVTGRTAKERIRVGETLPVEFRLKNLTEGTLKVLPSLDASDAGWRYPKCTMEVRDAKGALQQRPLYRCGNTNSLKARDFVELRPGESLPPFHHHMLRWTPSSPGTYTVRFVYDITPADPAAWSSRDGALEADALKLLEAMPRGRFESNILTLTVEP